MFGFGDDTNSLTMDKPQPVSRLDTTVQGLVGLGVERVDGPDKVSGQATYADRKSTRLNSSHSGESRMPSSA